MLLDVGPEDFQYKYFDGRTKLGPKYTILEEQKM